MYHDSDMPADLFRQLNNVASTERDRLGLICEKIRLRCAEKDWSRLVSALSPPPSTHDYDPVSRFAPSYHHADHLSPNLISPGLVGGALSCRLLVRVNIGIYMILKVVGEL
jgi:hypothetical protein